MEAARLKAHKERLEPNNTIAASDVKMRIYADYIFLKKNGHNGMNDLWVSTQAQSCGCTATHSAC